MKVFVAIDKEGTEILVKARDLQSATKKAEKLIGEVVHIYKTEVSKELESIL